MGTRNHEQAAVKQQIICLQGLGALPEELVIRTLRAPSTSLAEQVRLLPSTFHTAAVHVAFLSLIHI